MRLLNVTTTRLESFYGDNIPRYAILSHMWGRNEDEVMFKHVAGSDDDRREGECRKGYAKLLRACEQASRDKWQYIWIDTCCIDKQSSAELSEAINSMYTWYRRSEVCYAYLEDVQSDMKTGDGENGTFGTVPFKESRWFTRGWTLQELIAPRRVVFYSSDWIGIGTKTSLRDVISAVTNIRVEMVTNYDPDKASVAEKMSWAAKRQTTREEDIAYCLMGLLGVNMPLLYGEGTRAFRRLQEENMKVSDDHSIFAWRATYDHVKDHSKLMEETRGMLADSPSDFLGAGNVVQSNDEGLYPPYSMSNKGLQIGLPIKPINPKEELIGINPTDSQNIFKAILDCTYRDTNPTRWVVIYLKMVGKGRYVRISSHWLDGTQMNPNEADMNGWAITSLLVPQITTSTVKLTTRKHYKVKVLPTESGYNYGGYRNLVEGWEYFHHHEDYYDHEPVHVFIFGHEGGRFGVVIGWDEGMFWIDVITEDDYKHESGSDTDNKFNLKMKSLYGKDGSKYHVVQQHLNFLCVNPSRDHSVDVSGKMVLMRIPILGHYTDCYEFTIDIQRVKGSHLEDSIGSNYLGHLDPRNVHPNFKREGVDWFAIFNSKVKSALDISLVHSFKDENISIRFVVTLFSPNGEYLAIATKSEIRIYNTMIGDMTCVPRNEYIPNLDACRVCFSPNSIFLAIGTSDGQIFLWDITKKYVRRITSANDHQHYGTKVLRFSPDGRSIIHVSQHGMARILGIDNRTLENFWWLEYKNEALSSVAISPDNRLIAGVHDDSIMIRELETNRLVEMLSGQGYSDVNSIVFTPNGKGVVSGSRDKTLKYRHIGEHSNNIEPQVPIRSHMDIKHEDNVSHVAVSHDGNWFISISSGKVQFWDSRNGAVQFMLQSRITDSVRSFAMSPAGNMFATYSGQNRVQIWKYDSIVATDHISKIPDLLINAYLCLFTLNGA